MSGRAGFAALLLAPALALGAPVQAAEGEEIYTLVLVDRLEYQTAEGHDILLWDAQGWLGGDYDKLWLKTEGERARGDLEEAELQALYSRAVAPFWDLQLGVKHDFAPHPARTSGVIGIQGLARYWFEVDAAAFVSEDGDVSARVEAEYDLLLTQRLVLQPRAELNFAIQDVDELGIGSGLSTAELGLRLRYEIKREVAPYVGVSWSRKVGETARFARAEGEDAGVVSLVAGLRLWF